MRKQYTTAEKRPVEGYARSRNMSRVNIQIPWDMLDQMNERFLASKHGCFSHYVREMIRRGMEQK
jgi:hypothetical protein